MRWITLRLTVRSTAIGGLEQETDLGCRHTGRTCALELLGQPSDADRELAVAEQTIGHEESIGFGLVYAARNEPDRAVAWL